MSSEPIGKADGTALTGVSETALLTLRVRANEARRPGAIIDDPMAIILLNAIDHDYGKFGPARRQDMALRALAFDNYARRYLVDHPAATVVALAEGLQTSFYRLDAAGVWATNSAGSQWIYHPSSSSATSCCRIRIGCRCAPSQLWTSAGWTG